MKRRISIVLAVASIVALSVSTSAQASEIDGVNLGMQTVNGFDCSVQPLAAPHTQTLVASELYY